jgi:hypothetical protein
MPSEPTVQQPPGSDEPTVAFHGHAAVPPDRTAKYAQADYPVTAVPYQRPPRSAAVPILSAFVVVLLLMLVALAGYSVSAGNDARKRQDQLAAQLAQEQRQVQDLQAQLAAAKAEAEKARQGQNGQSDDAQGTVQQLTSCSDALDGVLKARSGSDFSKAFQAMKDQCKIAGISLF